MPRKNQRLQRVYRDLSAKERALMLYSDMCEQREVDKEIYVTMPVGQGSEFNFFIRLINAIFHTLGPLGWDLHRRAQIINLQVLLYRTHVQWSVDRLLLHRERTDLAGLDGDDIDISGPSAPWNLVPATRGRPDPVTGVVMQDTKRDLFALDLYEKVVSDLPVVWRDTLAFEKVLNEAVSELGEAEAPRWISDQLDETRSTLTSLTSLIDLTERNGIVLGNEIDEEQLEMLRSILKNARLP